MVSSEFIERVTVDCQSLLSDCSDYCRATRRYDYDYQLVPCRFFFLQDLEEQKRTKYKINGTATTAIEKSNPNLPAKSRLPYSYQEHEQGGQQRQPRDSHQLPQIEQSVT